MATKLYFKSEVYNSVKSYIGQQPARTATVPSNAAGGTGGSGIINNATQTFGVVGHDLAYNPDTGRWLLVGDSGGASLFATWAAWADNIEGPWTISTGVFDNASAYCLIGCVYAFGKFFVVDDTNGRIWSSTTAESGTWSLAYTPTTLGAARSMVYINGRIVTCMNGSVLATTTDGTNWTTITLPGSGVVAYGIGYSAVQNRWVVAGGSATVWYSSDFVNWTRVNLQGQSDNTRAVFYSDRLGLWVVCGNNGFISTTADPTSAGAWTTRTSGTTNILISILSDDNYYMALGDLKTIVKSTDLVNWTTTQFTTDTSDFWNGRYINGVYYLIAERSPNLLWSTEDFGATIKVLCSHKSRRVVQPGFLANFGKPVMTEEALQLRTLSTTIGTGQVASTIDTLAITTPQTGLLGIFATNPIANESVVVGAGSIVLNCADANTDNTSMAFYPKGVNIYVWRPSTSSIVGYILDAADLDLSTASPKTFTSTETVTHITGILGAPVPAIEGDIIVVEVWTTMTQGMATSYTGTWYYNGTTENTTQGSAATNHASYIEFTENITFKTGRANFYSYTSI